MHVDAGDLDARQLGGAGIDRAGAARSGCRTCSPPCRSRSCACVLASTSGLTRSDDARRRGPCAAAMRRQQLELRLGLDVEAEDAVVERESISRAVLPTPENMIFARPARRRRARGAARLPRRRPCRRRAWPASPAPPGSNSPSWRSRSARAVRRRRAANTL